MECSDNLLIVEILHSSRHCFATDQDRCAAFKHLKVPFDITYTYDKGPLQ